MSKGIANLERVPVLGTEITASSFEEARQAVFGMVQRRAGCYVSPANTYSVMLGNENPGYRRAVNGACYVTADGMPIVWSLRALGYRAERVHNDDLFLACCERFRDWRHFLVGGRTGQPEKVAEELRRRFEGIRIVGIHATPQRPVLETETSEILAEIRATLPDIVWVGMGTPAQDYWMAEAANRAGLPMIAVGSAFDVLAGQARQAPGWMKRNGLQWLFRLIQDPGRLSHRYFYYGPRFVLAFTRQWVRLSLGR